MNKSLIKNVLAILFLALVAKRAEGSKVPPGLRVGEAGHVFDHLGDYGDQAESAAASGASIIYITGLGGLGYGGLPAPGELKSDKEKTRVYLKSARQKGIRHAIGYVCATSIVDLDHFDEKWSEDFRQQFHTPPKTWLQQDRNGKPLPSWYGGKYFPACMSNPDWRRYEHFVVRQQLEAGCDGIFFDNPTVHPLGCYCLACMKNYVHYMGEAGSPQNLTSFDLEQIRNHASTHPEAFMAFRCTIARDFLTEMRRFARSIKPNSWTTANNSLNSRDVLYSQARTYGYNIFEMSRAEDFVVVEDMSGQPRSVGGKPVEYAPAYEQLRAISHEKPVVAVTLADGDYHTPPHLARLAMAEAAAHGCSYLWWPTWAPEQRSRMQSLLKPQVDFFRQNAALLNEVIPRAEVLLLLPATGYLKTGACQASLDAERLSAASIDYEVAPIEELDRCPAPDTLPRVILEPAGFSLTPLQQKCLNKKFSDHHLLLNTGSTNWWAQALNVLNPVSIRGPGAQWIRASVGAAGKKTIVQLINLNVEKISAYEDKVIPARDLDLRLSIPGKKPSKIRWLSPEDEGTASAITFSQSPGKKESWVDCHIPKLEINAILVIE